MPTLQGIKPGAYRGGRDTDGKFVEADYTVLRADDPLQATECPGLPDLGDPCDIESTLTLKSLEASLVEDTVNTYIVTAIYRLPGAGGPGPTTQQTATWSFSTQTQKRFVDIDGATIGTTHFVRRVGNTIVRQPMLDESAELGLDTYAGMVEIEVNKPVPSVFNAANVAGLIATVNQDNMTIDGAPFGPREVMLVGAGARRTASAPLNEFEITYRFVAGVSELPTGILKFLARNGQQTTIVQIPLGDGYVPMFEPRTKNDLFAPTLESAVQKVPVAVNIHRLYPSGDFSVLGVT